MGRNSLYIQATDGTEFWVPVKYPSGIWRVQKLVAGANGVFSRYADECIHHGAGHRAYLDRATAVADAQYRLRLEYNAMGKVLTRLRNQYKNMGAFILCFYENCKEER